MAMTFDGIEHGEITMTLGVHRACSVCGDVRDRMVALNRRVWLCVKCGRRVGVVAEALGKTKE